MSFSRIIIDIDVSISCLRTSLCFIVPPYS